MKRDVLLTVVGRHREKKNEEWDSMEIRTTGTLMEKNEDLYLFYDEILGESQNDVSHNRIKIEQDPLLVTITKSGAVNSVMSFGENMDEKSDYATPFGSLKLGVFTKAIQFNNENEQLDLHIHYNLEVNYEPMYESEITIQANPLVF